MSAFFRGWRNSGKNILPGILSPNNVIIPELDFRDGAVINSINGWIRYTNPLQLLNAFIRNFYEKAIIHYPWLETILDRKWIFQSCLEALKIEDGKLFLIDLLNELNSQELNKSYSEIKIALTDFISNVECEYYTPLKIINAVERYNDWLFANPEATVEAKEQTIRELISLYNLNIKNESDRFYLYQNTYFRESSSEIRTKFNEIINRLYRNKDEKATQLIELTELQSLINNADDRLVFTRMLFPRGASPEMKIVQTGANNISKTIIKSFIKDNSGDIYTFREASHVSEIGNLYRIFFKENYPKVLSELDEYYVLTDSIDRIIGGLCYRKVDSSSVLIDGGIVISSMSNRGLGSAMLEDFCARMASQGYEYAKAHFFLKNFYMKRGFKFDKRHGTLVRFLNSPQSSLIEGNYCII
jgi:GNAT superfamily N-acetyltransferase/translation initiation factor 2 beta subunit (eIF-2beta)/eIF-5